MKTLRTSRWHDNIDEFFATTEPRLNTETAKQLFEEVKDKYEKVKQQPAK